MPLWMVTRFRRESSENIEFFYAKNHDDVVTVILYYVLFFCANKYDHDESSKRLHRALPDGSHVISKFSATGKLSNTNFRVENCDNSVVLDCNQSFSVFFIFLLILRQKM